MVGRRGTGSDIVCGAGDGVAILDRAGAPQSAVDVGNEVHGEHGLNGTCEMSEDGEVERQAWDTLVLAHPCHLPCFAAYRGSELVLADHTTRQ